ncbi:hypothetical protein BH23ACT2_BH23ACT2_18760 [soil metagenome]
MTTICRRPTAVLCALLLALAACSTSGDPERTITAAELEDVAPTAADLGDGWATGDTDESDSEDDAPDFEDECPELARLAGADDDEDQGSEFEAAFEHTDGRLIEITLDPDAREATDEEIDELVEAINACGEVTFTDDDGFETVATLSAETTGAYGDQGVRLSLAAEVSGPGLAQPVSVNIDAHLYRRGTVGVEVRATDGVGDDLEVTPSDLDQLDSLAARIDANLEDLFME